MSHLPVIERLIELVERGAEERLRPEILRGENDPVEGGRTRRSYDAWVAREAWGRYLPDTGEIWLSRGLVDFASARPGDGLLRTLVHELVHFVQSLAGTPLEPISNTVLVDYAENRHLLPAESLQAASEWVRRHYAEDLRPAEEMALLAEDENLWEHPVFARIMYPEKEESGG